MQRRNLFSLLGAALLLGTVAAPRAQAQLPPQSQAYGHSLGEWLKIYAAWTITGGPDTVGRVRLMPIPAETQISGSGTPEDPAILEGHLDVTLKRETPFMLPIVYWFGESYAPGTPVAFNPDPVIPRSVFEASDVRITMDGKTIIDNTKERRLRYYVDAQYFDTPIVYPQPSSYGSISADYAQGFAFVHQPLSKGVHTMTLESGLFVPGGGFYPNLPDGLGVKFKNTWTITVK